MSNVLVITTSLRGRSNSDILAERMIKGAEDAGNQVEYISLKNKEIRFCIGCLSCQKTQECILKDDAIEIAEKVKNADSVVFVTPIYYYEMSGQLKTLLDRLNPLYSSDYKFRKVYMLTTAAEDKSFVPEKAESGLQGPGADRHPVPACISQRSIIQLLQPVRGGRRYMSWLNWRK